MTKTRKRTYIVVVGKMLSGKETVFAIIQEELKAKKSVHIHRFSDVLNDMLALLYKKRTRKNLQTLSTVLRAPTAFGEGVLGNVVHRRAKRTKADVIVFDGARRPHDIAILGGLGNVVILAVTAPLDVRFARARKRRRPGEQAKTREEFVREDRGEPELLIETIAKRANYTIENTGTREELRKKVRAFLKNALRFA
ncbi:MAG: hypothetical protein A3I44_00485 [Candidatus Sungbacteria bacterium RIFCSPLOWO2_02_FULL_51_17]|uniref:Dephospho-CoA kinase n=1 Tax=Candidatus Sungbacteria bacterium RIFCSPHIGHO2_02_FULL_51_29 TaxID=1802273 RepID=A0A1G2KTH3_9BACT|nr:MAG: hypothetical protein A3C16_00580 [Candidatus Sungbacteria bacterium RIFCSPHIGHO2_02_FULL_51_29]OHA07766.1 MAG: hypothetical protein A3B29_00565 [Candidatus Sungbacteria bacterium RIFCSPLOWO2_01_FULL_51_34]OHA12570.1 MAG: hypothetical protein A3I44_00485 [Candidatus Sungbacteria bacterium RIFCSPLOWO2_02_FULL_51_17]